MSSAYYVAFTAPINPAGASPVLTRAQIWAGLEKKIRAGQDFVGSAITATDVIKEYRTEETDLPVTIREVVFRDPLKGRVEEKCIAFYPMKVEFHQKDGSKIQNVVSQGAGGEHDLYMTYEFEWRHPELEGKDDELKKQKYEQDNVTAKTTVESTIEVMRKMVRDGLIK